MALAPGKSLHSYSAAHFLLAFGKFSFANLPREPGPAIPLWIPICLILQGAARTTAQSAPVTTAVDLRLTQQPSTWELLHRPGKQACIQTALMLPRDFQQRKRGSNPTPSEAGRDFHWDEMKQHWAPHSIVHTQHGDRYSSVIQVAEQTKVSLQDATMNAATLFHLPRTKELRAQEN